MLDTGQSSPEQVIADTIRKYALFDPRDPDHYAARVKYLAAGMLAHRERIEDALAYAHGSHQFDDLMPMVLRGDLLFWDLDDSFMLTEILTYPQAAHFHIFLAGGNMETLVAMHADVIPFARALGCSTLTISGRRGWVRALEDHGWKLSHVTLGKDISDG